MNFMTSAPAIRLSTIFGLLEPAALVVSSYEHQGDTEDSRRAA